jgi:hypothetical protein
MANIASLDHFIFNSDFPADMITYFKTDNFSIPARGTGTKTYSHSLGYIPLCFGVWATSEDFSDSRPISDGYFNFVISATDSQVKLAYDFSEVTSATTVYVRLYGFPPAEYTGYCPATAQSSKSLIFNTDDNYSPLIFEGTFTTKSITQPSESVSLEYNITTFYQKQIDTGNSLTVYHKLPYRPYVMLWGEQNGETKLAAGATFDYWGGWYSQTFPDCSYGDGDVFINLGDGYEGSPIIKTHIRIYA